MKKFLGFMVMSLVAIIPFSVSAASEITYNCGNADAEGNRTCTVGYKIDQSTPQDTVSVTLTEEGGADITSIEGVTDSEFSISTTDCCIPAILWNAIVILQRMILFPESETLHDIPSLLL